MTDAWLRDIEAILGERARRRVPLKRFTTWRVGGPADVMCVLQTEDEAAKVLAALGRAGRPWLVIGQGSNLLVSDDGVEGAVLRLEGDFSRIEIGEETKIEAGAGATLSQVLRFAAAHHLTGLEFTAGIPGSLGGAAIMNAGAYGRALADVIDRLRIMDERGGIDDLLGDRLSFGYRRLDLPAGTLVLGARLGLSPGSRPDIEAEIDRRLLARRQSQPLSRPSAGSVFKNPPGDYAARLIEACGLKGKQSGGAQVSEKHANFILNLGNATATDIVTLMRQVAEEVEARLGVTLSPEVRCVGRGLNGAALSEPASKEVDGS